MADNVTIVADSRGAWVNGEYLHQVVHYHPDGSIKSHRLNGVRQPKTAEAVAAVAASLSPWEATGKA